MLRLGREAVSMARAGHAVGTEQPLGAAATPACARGLLSSVCLRGGGSAFFPTWSQMSDWPVLPQAESSGFLSMFLTFPVPLVSCLSHP